MSRLDRHARERIRIRAWWDEEHHGGWYAIIEDREDGWPYADSCKAGFRIALNLYERDQADRVEAAIARAYPGVELEVDRG